MQHQRRLVREVLPIFLILVTVFSFNSCMSPPSEEMIRERVADFDEAFRTGDVTALDDMISENYLHTNPSGNVISRENWLSWNRSRAEELNSGVLTVESYETSELDIRIVSFNTALVSGINEANGVRNGEPFQTKVRFSHVWILEDGNWKRAVFHDSYIN